MLQTANGSLTIGLGVPNRTIDPHPDRSRGHGPPVFAATMRRRGGMGVVTSKADEEHVRYGP